MSEKELTKEKEVFFTFDTKESVYEIVIPNETGFLVPVDDPAALADKIIFVLRNPELQKRMGRNARQMVAELLSVDPMARAFEALMIPTLTIKKDL